MVKKSFPLLGLHCAACAAHATKALEATAGVQSATVNLASATAFIVYNETLCTPDVLRDAVAALGYTLRINEPEVGELEALRQREASNLRRKTWVAVILSLIVMGLMMWPPMTLTKALLSALLTAITYSGLALASSREAGDSYARGLREWICW